VPEPAGPPAFGSAFLLAQVGAHATARYAERVAQLNLTPAHTGMLHMIARQQGLSQQTLASRLGMLPSKIVSLVDELETRQLLERRRNPSDRRNYALYLTDQGQRALDQVRDIAREHERDITDALTEEERASLTALLRKLADRHGLSPGVHPGYRRLS
jgi:DNA-binding MarR family transcriptional regulator